MPVDNTTPDHNFVVLDTETTGLPRYASFSCHYPPHLLQHYNSSRLIELGVVAYDFTGELNGRMGQLILPEGPYELDPKAVEVHGIQPEHLIKKGARTGVVLERFYKLLLRCGAPFNCTIVGHNVAFDWHIICSEAHRVAHWGLVDLMFRTPTYCTMLTNTHRCGLRMRNGRRKWPKLCELYDNLFPNEGMVDAHSALGDAVCTARCFFEIYRREAEPFDQVPNNNNKPNT